MDDIYMKEIEDSDEFSQPQSPYVRLAKAEQRIRELEAKNRHLTSSLGWRPIEEAPADEWLMAGKWHDTRAVWCREWQVFKDEAIMSNYTHYLPQPEPPEKENT